MLQLDAFQVLTIIYSHVLESSQHGCMCCDDLN